MTGFSNVIFRLETKLPDESIIIRQIIRDILLSILNLKQFIVALNWVRMYNQYQKKSAIVEQVSIHGGKSTFLKELLHL